jgi:hypothetical protein
MPVFCEGSPELMEVATGRHWVWVPAVPEALVPLGEQYWATWWTGTAFDVSAEEET